MRFVGFALLATALFLVVEAHYLFNASDHMGSLIRLNSSSLASCTDDVHKKQRALGVVETGLHGFNLLAEALLCLVGAAAVCGASGVVILALTVGGKPRKIPDADA